MILNNYMTMQQIGTARKDRFLGNSFFELHRRVTEGISTTHRRWTISPRR